MPERIQLSRKKGWKKPENTVVVSRLSKWGNPFVITRGQGTYWVHDARVDGVFLDSAPNIELAQELAYARFRRALRAGTLSFTADDVRRELAGKNLACWCKFVPGQPDHCHADFLLSIANETGGDNA